jgi:hypothetical protein
MPLMRALEQAVTPNITATNSNKMPGMLVSNTAIAVHATRSTLTNGGNDGE